MVVHVYPIVTLDDANSVYADVEMADAYLDGALHADNWRTLDDDSKGRALITSVRILDRQIWLGAKNDDANELDWPRKNTGIVGVTDDVVPVDIEYATIELALSLSQGSTVQSAQSGESNIQSLRAGSAAITYFRPLIGNLLPRFPLIVWELIRPYMTALPSVSLAPSQSFGTCLQTVTGKQWGFTRGL